MTNIQKNTMRWVLFWTFWAIFTLTSIAVLAMIFFNFGNVQVGERSTLINTFIIETGVAIIALFYSIFKLTKGTPHENDENEIKEIATRDSYIQAQIRVIDQAKNSLLLSVPKLHPEEQSNDAKKINGAIRRATGRGVIVKILVAATEDRLIGAMQLLNQENLDLRFDPTLVLSDLSYLCADNELIIIGARKGTLDSNYSPSNEWYELKSGVMITSLDAVFKQKWTAPATLTLEQMLRRYLPANIKTSGVVSIADQLGHSQSFVEKYKEPKPFYILMLGRPGSGKSTISKAIINSLSAVNISAKHITDLKFFYDIFRDNSSTSFKKTEDGGYYVTEPNLYIEATKDISKKIKQLDASISFVIIEIARANYLENINVLINEGITPDLVVYIDVPFEMAHYRNLWRKDVDGAHYVSKEEMEATFSNDDSSELSKNEKFKFVTICNPDISESTSEVIAGEIIGKFKDSI